MSKKHFGKGGGRDKFDENCGDLTGDYQHLGKMQGLKRALAIIAESPSRAVAYKRIRLIVRNDGMEKKERSRL